MGVLDVPVLARGRAGERPLLVAEQLGGDQGRRHRRAIERDIRTLRAHRALVDRAGHQFLAGAALAGDQHRHITGGEAAHLVEDFEHRRAVADHEQRRRARRRLAGGRRRIEREVCRRQVGRRLPPAADGAVELHDCLAAHRSPPAHSFMRHSASPPSATFRSPATPAIVKLGRRLHSIAPSGALTRIEPRTAR